MADRVTGGDRYWTAAIVVLALLIRAGAFAAWPDNIHDDRDTYLELAQQVVNGKGYSNPATGMPTAFRPPLYPLLLAGILMIDGTTAIALIQCMAGAATVWLTMLIGRRLGLGAGSLFAGALVAVDPLLVQHATLPMTETLCALLATLLVWMIVSVGRDASAASAKPAGQLLIGVVFGLCALSRPTFWAFGAVAALSWVIVRFKRTRRSHSQQNDQPSGSEHDSPGITSVVLRWPVWLVVGTIVAVTPWVVRNLFVFSRPILTTTHGGYTLLLGNNPVFYRQEVEQPWGTAWEDAPPAESQSAWYAQLQTDWRKELGEVAGEVEIDRWMKQRAYRNIGDSPLLFLRACWHRLVRFWGFAPTGPSGRSIDPILWWAVWVFYAVVFGGFVCGLWGVMRSPTRRTWTSPLLLIASFAIVHVVYWSNMRLRAPVIPMIALVSVCGWRVLWGLFRGPAKARKQ